MIANRETKLSELTLGELLDCIDEHLAGKNEAPKIYGLDGLAKYLNCSVRSASRLKSSGRINKAVTQSGRKIVIDTNILRNELRLK